MKRDTRKILLDSKQEAWLKKNFMHTKNEEICRKMGFSLTTLARFAREYGLKKSPQFLHKVWSENGKKAKIYNIVHDVYPHKGYVIPGSEKYRFRKGVTPLQRLGREKNDRRRRKSAESRRETIRKERARIAFGLPQKTKIKLGNQSRKHILLRYYLKKKGYIIDDEKGIAYYNKSTKRGSRIERKEQPWYIFQPIEKRDENVNDVNDGTTEVIHIPEKPFVNDVFLFT